ncbi:MAG: hypothetical protein KKA41_17415, partial [Proteobacteria bacterium]|nr:hypothetical protein [Pseudomonadota bacterium]
PCHSNGECGLLPSDPNKKYVCVDASGQDLASGLVLDGSATGTCVIWDGCDPRLQMLNGQNKPCGPGTHCEVVTWGSTGGDRMTFCIADEGTTSIGGQPVQGWTSLECPGGTVIERCSNTATNQRVRYCSNDPDYATNAIRWNGWVGPSEQTCVSGGELWGVAPQHPNEPVTLPSNAPAGFYDTHYGENNDICPLGTRITRCSNTYPGQLVSYCAGHDADPEQSVIRWDNWVGPNDETCTTQGENIATSSNSTVQSDNNLTNVQQENIKPSITPLQRVINFILRR